MTKVTHKIVTKEGVKTISVVVDGEPYIAFEDNPNWDKIVAAAQAKDPNVVNLIEPIKDVEIQFQRLSDRMTVRGRSLYWDGDPVDHALADQILRFLQQGLDFEPLVKFYDKISQNPSQNSQKQLFQWLRKFKFTITADGDIVGYKGYRGVKNGYESTSMGHAFVNDEEFGTEKAEKKVIPCKDGDIVYMPRHEVADNPQADCSTGLHVGTPSYAKGFGNTRVAILINPRDVVSVPTIEAQKMRVCRYYVLGKVNTEIVTAILMDAPKWEDVKTTGKPTPAWGKTLDRGVREPAPQPSSRVLEDEKPRARRTTKVTARPGKGLKDKPRSTEPTGQAKIDWNDPEVIKKLQAANTAEKRRAAFPGISDSTLRKRYKDVSK